MSGVARPADSACATTAASGLEHDIRSAGHDWVVPRWLAPRAIRAFVTTRNGGVSRGVATSLDVGGASTAAATPEAAAAIAENRRRIERFLPAPPVWLAQVHGTDVAVIGDRRPGTPPRADAAITRDANVVLAVRIADCMPVLLADRAGTVIGVAHAGWRGLAAGVIENTLAAMACTPSQVVAWLGPAIGRDAFEVGADVRDAFVRHDAEASRAFVDAAPGKWHADLEALARMRLARAGVTSVVGGGMCTLSDPARFFSFRRDGTSGRMAAFLWRVDARA